MVHGVSRSNGFNGLSFAERKLGEQVTQGYNTHMHRGGQAPKFNSEILLKLL